MLQKLFLTLQIDILFDLSRLVITISFYLMLILGTIFYFKDWILHKIKAEKGTAIDNFFNNILEYILWSTITVVLLGSSMFFITRGFINIIGITPVHVFEYKTVTYDGNYHDNSYYLHFREFKDGSGYNSLEFAYDEEKMIKDIILKMKINSVYKIIIKKNVPSRVPIVDTFSLANDYKKFNKFIYGIKGQNIDYDFRPFIEKENRWGNLFLVFIGLLFLLSGIWIFRNLFKAKELN